MADEKPKKRNRTQEYIRLREKRQETAARKELAATDDPGAEQAEIVIQLALLAKRTADSPTDADRDIDFAYRNSGNPAITPLMAPSLGAWQWYEYARTLPDKFLEICAKREDAKAKQSGSINAQRMEDDKRQQFAILDRIEKQLTVDVKSIIKDLMAKFPEDTLLECRKYTTEWNDFHKKYPL